jgi:hypothetical protein
MASLERLSTDEHKYDDVRGKAFLAQARREWRAYPRWVCKERATKPKPKRTAAQRVVLFLAWGVVARRLQPHFGDAPSSRLASNQKQRNERHRIYAHQYWACSLKNEGQMGKAESRKLKKAAAEVWLASQLRLVTLNYGQSRSVTPNYGQSRLGK